MKNVFIDCSNSPEIKYPKIQTLFKRNNKGKIIKDELSKPHFYSKDKWLCLEKIDGSNCRVIWYGREKRFEIRGRNDRSQMNSDAYHYVEKAFDEDVMDDVFSARKNNRMMHSKVILFGEVYGGTIQKKGKQYRSTPSFVLFDAYINGWWIDYSTLTKIASLLNVDCVPTYGKMSTEEIIDYVEHGPVSLIAENDGVIAEGIVAVSEPLVLFTNGYPLKWKLKVKDFR